MPPPCEQTLHYSGLHATKIKSEKILIDFDLGLYIVLSQTLFQPTRKVFKKKHTCGLLFAKLGYTF